MPSVKPSGRRAQLRRELAEAIRRHSTATVLFHAAIAERLGLNATDHKAADLLMQRGPLSAGELADLTGLTTGAVTGMIDRLERAGWVRRGRDPTDRRRVIVAIALGGESLRRVQRVFEPVAHAVEGVLDRYSDAELAMMLEFVERTRRLVEDEMARLRRPAAKPSLRGSAAPRPPRPHRGPPPGPT